MFAGLSSVIRMVDTLDTAPRRRQALYSATTLPDGTKVFQDGSKYKVTRSGAWIRLNHPSNKHERRG